MPDTDDESLARAFGRAMKALRLSNEALRAMSVPDETTAEKIDQSDALSREAEDIAYRVDRGSLKRGEAAP